MGEAVVNSRKGSAIDMTGQNGLRGLLSIWIVVFHCLYYDHNPIDLQGSSLMPLFFLLSGFSLTIGYYKKIMNPSIPQVYPLPSTQAGNGKDVSTFDWWRFMYLRLVRVLPVYVIANALCYPAFFQGFGAFDPKDTSLLINTTLTTFIPVATWLGGFLGMPFDGPAWTVCTLIGMWLFFPSVLRWLANKSDHALLQWIRYFYWIQMIVLIVVFVVLLIVLGGNFWPAFICSTMHPLSRLPVFAMGVAAGILTLRHPPNHDSLVDKRIEVKSTGEEGKKDEYAVVPTADEEVAAVAAANATPAKEVTHMPWFQDGAWYMPLSWFFCGCCVSKDDPSSVVLENTTYASLGPVEATSLLHTQALSMFGLTAFTVIIDIIARYAGGADGIMGSIWLQALNPFAQLSFIVALTRCDQPTDSTGGNYRRIRASWLAFVPHVSVVVM